MVRGQMASFWITLIVIVVAVIGLWDYAKSNTPASITIDLGKTCVFDCLVGQIVPVSITISPTHNVTQEIPIEVSSEILDHPIRRQTLAGSNMVIPLKLSAIKPGEYEIAVSASLPPGVISWIRKLFFGNEVKSTIKIKVRYPDIKVSLPESYEKTEYGGIFFKEIKLDNEEKALETAVCKLKIKINDDVTTHHPKLTRIDELDNYQFYETEFMNVTHVDITGIKDVQFDSKESIQRIVPTLTPVCNINDTILDIEHGSIKLDPIIVR